MFCLVGTSVGTDVEALVVENFTGLNVWPRLFTFPSAAVLNFAARGGAREAPKVGAPVEKMFMRRVSPPGEIPMYG